MLKKPESKEYVLKTFVKAYLKAFIDNFPDNL
jgi:hypothetical protein